MSTLAPLSSSRQQGAELLAIYEISKILSSSLDLTRTLRGVLNLLASYMRMQRGTVSLLDAGDELRAVGAADLSGTRCAAPATASARASRAASCRPARPAWCRTWPTSRCS